MKDKIKFILALLMCVIVFWGFVQVTKTISDAGDRIVRQVQPKVEEPERITGKWQIALFHVGMIPTKTIKTSLFYVKDKVVWYRDEKTGEELPLPDGAIVLPDDGRDLETYGVYKLVKPD